VRAVDHRKLVDTAPETTVETPRGDQASPSATLLDGAGPALLTEAGRRRSTLD